MTIRFKLLVSFGIMLTTVLATGAASFWAVNEWQRTSDSVEAIRSQNLEAELLRGHMFHQITDGLDRLSGVSISQDDFVRLQEKISTGLAHLKMDAESETEEDHIVGLEETQFELNWIVMRFFQNSGDHSVMIDTVAGRERLREIADDLTDDALALSQFYRDEMRSRLSASSDAFKISTAVISVAVGIALAQLLAMIFLTQRWLVRPIAAVSRATSAISTGKFESRVDIYSHDEWGALAESVNTMAASLEKLNEELRARERLAALGEIVAYAAHNIRNPLASIRAASQVTYSDLKETHPDSADTLKEIISTVDRMEVWMKGLLALASPTTLELESIALEPLLREAASITSSRFSQEKVRVTFSFEEQMPDILIDSSLIQQVIVNLLANAFESGCSQTSIESRLHEVDGSGTMVEIKIVDDGEGISDEMKSKLFRAFATDKKHGTGLGLAQARKIVTLHRGKLTIASEKGKGTEVTMLLPVATNETTVDTSSQK